MAGTITTDMSTSFKSELMQALHNFTASTGNTFKMALFVATVTATWNYTATNYGTGSGTPSTSNMGIDEVSGTGYTAGGVSLSNTTPAVGTTSAYTTFAANPSWTSASFSTSGCMIYNSTSGDRCVGVWSFGGTQTVTSGTFTVLMPTNAASTALLQLN